MNIRRRRSSPISSSIASTSSGSGLPCRASSSTPNSSCLRSASLPWRRWSIARCFAVAMSQAPGLSGTPDSGHRSSATTRASCARSSASPTSRTMRASPAMSLGASILQTASIARWVSVAVTATDHTIFPPRLQDRGAPRLPPRGPLRAQALFLLPELGRERLAEVLRLEHLANLDLDLLTVGVGTIEGGALEPLDRLFLRLHLPQPEAGHQLLGLCERSVDHGALTPGEADARALGAILEPLGGEQHAGLRQLLVELPHLGEDLLVRQDALLRVLVRLDQHHESHRPLLALGVESRAPGRSRPDRTLLQLYDDRASARSTAGAKSEAARLNARPAMRSEGPFRSAIR